MQLGLMKYQVHYIAYHSEFDRFKKIYDLFKSNQKKLQKNKEEEEPENNKQPKIILQRIEVYEKKLVLDQYDIQKQFGKQANDKLQRLLFLIKDNQDVFDIFCEKFIDYQLDNPHHQWYRLNNSTKNVRSQSPNKKFNQSTINDTQTSGTDQNGYENKMFNGNKRFEQQEYEEALQNLLFTIGNFFFDNQLDEKNQQKLHYFVYKVTLKTYEILRDLEIALKKTENMKITDQEDQDKLFVPTDDYISNRNMMLSKQTLKNEKLDKMKQMQQTMITIKMLRNKLFQALTRSYEANICCKVIFLRKFERLDVDFLNQTNIYQEHQQEAAKKLENQFFNQNDSDKMFNHIQMRPNSFLDQSSNQNWNHMKEPIRDSDNGDQLPQFGTQNKEASLHKHQSDRFQYENHHNLLSPDSSQLSAGDKRDETLEGIISPEGKERKKTSKNIISKFGKSIGKMFLTDKEPRKSRMKSPIDENQLAAKDNNELAFSNIQPQQAEHISKQDSERRFATTQKEHEKQVSKNNMIKICVEQIVDIIDSMTDQLCQHVLSLPLPILYFCKAIYDFNFEEAFESELSTKQDREQSKKQEKIAFKQMGKYLIEEWLNKVAFEDTAIHGLSRTFFLKQNAVSNLQLIGIGLSKIFQLDDTPYKDEVLSPLNTIFVQKQDKVLKFYKEIVEIVERKDKLMLGTSMSELINNNYQRRDDSLKSSNLSLKNQSKLKQLFDTKMKNDPFRISCAVVSLADIKFFFEFISTYKESFSEKSFNAAKNLVNDISFLNKNDKIFENKNKNEVNKNSAYPEYEPQTMPSNNKNSNKHANESNFNESNQSEGQFGSSQARDMGFSTVTKFVDYYYFYKVNEEKLVKSSPQNDLEKPGDQFSENDFVLNKNLKLMLQTGLDLQSMKWMVHDTNNLVALRQSAILLEERSSGISNRNQDFFQTDNGGNSSIAHQSQNSNGYITELVFEHLFQKYQQLKNDKQELKAFIIECFEYFKGQKEKQDDEKENLADFLTQKLGQVDGVLISGLRREREQIEWLWKVNIDLAIYMKSNSFQDLVLWRFQDETSYLHMDLALATEDEAEFWIKETKKKQEWRDDFFKTFRNLLPQQRLKELEKQEATQPKAKAERAMKQAVEGNTVLKVILQKKGQGTSKAGSTVLNSQGIYNGSSDLLNSIMIKPQQAPQKKEDNARSLEEQYIKDSIEKYQLTLDHYNTFMNKTEEEKEDQYQRMGLPQLSRKRMYFKSIDLFPHCITKFCKQVVNRVLSENDENYGGLIHVLKKFQDIVEQRLKRHPILGQSLKPERFEVELPPSVMSQIGGQNFEMVDMDGRSRDSSMTISIDWTQVRELMIEINDYMMTTLYKEMFAYPKRMNEEQAEYQHVQEKMNLIATPEMFGTPSDWVNSNNMMLWQKCIREFRKLDKLGTPKRKLHVLVNSWKLIQVTFSLFTSAKEGNSASADDLVLLMPYIILKAKLPGLLLHIKFVKLFEYKMLGSGQNSYILTNLEASSKAILQIYQEQQDLNFEQLRAKKQKQNLDGFKQNHA